MWLYCNIIGAAQNPAENKWQESSFPHAWYWNSQIACPRFRFKLWHMCSNERVHHVRLHSIVVLPVNKDTNHSNEHRVFGYSRLILQLQSSFHRLQFCTCANFLNGSWTSNLKTSVLETIHTGVGWIWDQVYICMWKQGLETWEKNLSTGIQ